MTFLSANFLSSKFLELSASCNSLISPLFPVSKNAMKYIYLNLGYLNDQILLVRSNFKENDNKTMQTIVLMLEIFNQNKAMIDYVRSQIPNKIDQYQQSSQQYLLTTIIKMEYGAAKLKHNMRKERLKTLGTLDTFDFNLADSYYGKENRSRNGPTNAGHSKSATKKNGPVQHQKSHISAFHQSRLKQPKQICRIKRAMSMNQPDCQRFKTQYIDCEDSSIKKRSRSLKKKLVVPMDQSHKQCLQIVRKFYQSSQEEIFQVKSNSNKRQKHLMIKAKNISIKKQYERQQKAYVEITCKMKPKEKSHFLRIDQIYKSKKEWFIVTDHYYHATWNNDHFYLYLNQFKNNQSVLESLVKHIVETIHLLSYQGYSLNLSIESIYFMVFNGDLKYGDHIKISGLKNSFKISSKESFMSMPMLYTTPPEILNFIMFERNENFNRDNLEYIGQLNEGWRVDVWALGIIVLQLLNGGPLSGQGSGNRSDLITQQNQLLIRYSYLLIKINEKFRHLLTRMLSINPYDRPSPMEILRIL